MDVLVAIAARRSTGRLVGPAPTTDEIGTILRAAAQAPDHGSLRPFRFVVLQGAAKVAFGEVLKAAYDARCVADGSVAVEAKRDKERTKLGRAPLVVAVVAAPVAEAKVPRVEQEWAAAAACQNALLAATALGYGSMWRTGDPSYDPTVLDALGFGADAVVVGWLYLGSYGEAGPPAANGHDLDGLVSTWTPA